MRLIGLRASNPRIPRPAIPRLKRGWIIAHPRRTEGHLTDSIAACLCSIRKGKRWKGPLCGPMTPRFEPL